MGYIHAVNRSQMRSTAVTEITTLARVIFRGAGVLALALATSACVAPAEKSGVKLLNAASKPALDTIVPLSVSGNEFPANDSGVSKVMSSVQHACAVRGGELSCWGLNKHGQIGNGDSGVNEGETDALTGSNYMVKVALRPHSVFPDSVTDLALGYEHTCAIRSGDLYCWGSNEYGQLGLVPTSDAIGTHKILPTPTLVLKGVKKVAARGRWTCAITDADRLLCFGTRLKKSGHDQVPVLVARTPREVLVGAEAVSMSSNHACAIVRNGDESGLRCFGMNSSGEIGNGVEGDDVPAPFESLSSGVLSVSLADQRSCAVVTEGASTGLKCFGVSLGDRAIDETAGGWRVPTANPYDATFWNGVAPGLQSSASGAVIATSGDLLYGSYFHSGGKARKVALGVRAFDFAETDINGCMMFRNRSVKCWGSNLFGQLGTGRRVSEEVQLFRAQDVNF